MNAFLKPTTDNILERFFSTANYENHNYNYNFYFLTSYPYLTSYYTSDGLHSLQLYFSWHNCPSPSYSFVNKLFPDVEIFEVFCYNITPTKLRTPSGKNPRYYVIIYSSWSNILIHSPEVAKMSKAAPSDFFSETNYVKLFVEFLSSNTSFKSDTTDPVNHTIVSRC